MSIFCFFKFNNVDPHFPWKLILAQWPLRPSGQRPCPLGPGRNAGSQVGSSSGWGAPGSLLSCSPHLK